MAKPWRQLLEETGRNMFYPKIRTLYQRDENFKVITRAGDYTLPVFGNISKWLLTEKVDGTNMSVLVGRDSTDSRVTHIKARGRTKNAELGMFQQAINSVHLGSDWLDHNSDFEPSLHADMRDIVLARDLDSLEIFGEAFGPGIQSGGWYGEEQSFIIYDVRVNGRLWLPWDQVVATADTLSLRTVPVVQNNATIPFARHLCWQGFKSSLTKDDRPCEGVVARPQTGELTMNNGERVVWKLKHKDF